MTPTAVIFGAGKIGRGFIAHLLSLSGFTPVFVEREKELVHRLRSEGRYTIHVLAAPLKDTVIEKFKVIESIDAAAVSDAIRDTQVAFTAVGGPNLKEVGRLLAGGLRRRFGHEGALPLNVFICENYHKPAQVLREALAAVLPSDLMSRVGLVECQVLRSSIEASPDVLAHSSLELNVQDEWRLPCDTDAIVGPRPDIMGLVFVASFGASLERKLFTYNAANAAIAYLGHLAGYRLLAEAATDPDILRVARGVCDEAGRALVARYGFDPREQREFGEAALAKYANPTIVDPIERNARDPLRKLSRNDRLIGPASLCLEVGIEPEDLLTAIVAAVRYDEPSDPAAVRLQALLEEKGISGVLEEVCGLQENDALWGRISRRWAQQRGCPGGPPP